MVTIEFKDEMSPTVAEHVEVHDEWIIADVETDAGEIERHCVPSDRVKQVVGAKGDGDITLE